MPKKEKKSALNPGKKTVKKKPARKPVAARPRAAAAAPARVLARRVSRKSEVAALVDSCRREEIALKAYYLAERRKNLGLPGDSESDWLQAERKLRG